MSEITSPSLKMQWQVNEDIVISGISGRFPESDNLDELKENLYNHVDMITSDERRWPFDLYGLPNYLGKIRNLDKFDANFFGVLPIQTNAMDPQMRILHELTYEAIVDGGFNPQTLRGTKTGVYIGNCFTEVEDANLFDVEDVTVYSLLGTTKSMFANMLSNSFDFHGPSFTLDSACSSSFMALQQAILGIRTNQCDQAIVGGANLCLRPATSGQFLNANMLSRDGCCKHMDATANGYARAEAVCVILLQKKSNAKRIYASVIHAKTNTDGSKDSVTFPSWTAQRDLMLETADEANVDPSTVEYVEAHGTGTGAGDPVETKAIADVYCKNRVGPLPIGSTKSNLGHSEPSSGLCSLAKIIFSFENKLIPANIHFDTPNPNIPELFNGQVKVLVENEPYHGGIVAANSFGIGGVNVNVLLKPFNQEIEERNKQIVETIPRIIAIAGRTEESVNYVMNFIEKNPQKVNKEFLALLHDASQTTISSGLNYRGYLLADKHPECIEDTECTFPREIQRVPEKQFPVWFVYSGMGSQWISMARGLMGLDAFRESVLKSADILKPFNVDLLNLLLSEDKRTLENTVAPFVAISAIQVALTDVLTSVGIKPDGIVGHSLGEIGCAYCDGVLSQEQVLLTSYWRGKCVEDSNVPKGLMAAVGLSLEDTIARAPKGIVPACHNAEDSVTISGPYDEMVKFVEQLNAEGIFARIVKTGDVAYHSYYMDAVAPLLLSKMKQVIPEPTLRSPKWICSSVPQVKWTHDSAKYSSASYYVNNLTSQVLFYEAIQHVPKDAIVIEIAPHSLLQPIIKRNLGSKILYVNLMNRNNNENNLNVLLSAIGKLYNLGVNFDISKLYPKVNYPVSRGTQSLSPLIKWDHSQSWKVTLYPDCFNPYKPYTTEIVLNLKDFKFYKGHCVDGRILFPATGYLNLVLNFYRKIKGKSSIQSAVKFENVTLHRATILSLESSVKFEIRLIEINGEFCISENGTLVATGQMHIPESSPLKYQHILEKSLKSVDKNCNLVLNKQDVYKELRIRGYDYGQSFQAIEQVNPESRMGKIKFTNWVIFSDNMLQFGVLGLSHRGLYLPIRFQSVNYDPKIFYDAVNKQEGGDDKKALLDVITHPNIHGTIIAPGLEILGLKANLAPRREANQVPVLEKYIFTPYYDLDCITSAKMQRDLNSYIKVTTALAFNLANTLGDEKLKRIFKNISINLQESLIKEYSESKNDQYQLVKILKKLKIEANNIVNELTLVKHKELLGDLLSTVCESQYFLRHTIDTVIENLPNSNLNIIEVNATAKTFEEKAQEYIEFHSMRIKSKYSLHKLNVVDKDNSGQNTKLSFDENSADLILFKDGNIFNFDNSKIDYRSFLVSARKIVKNNGFLAAVFRSKMCLAEEMLFAMNKIKLNLNYINEFVKIANEESFRLVSLRSDSLTTSILLFRKIDKIFSGAKQTVIEVTNTNYSKWVEVLKEKLVEHQNRPTGENVWLLATDTPMNGIVGLVKCLRQEPGGERIRCIFNSSTNLADAFPSQFSFDNIFYAKVLQNDLVLNVYRDGKVGSFRHYEIDHDENECATNTEHAYLNVSTRGDLSSLKWYESTHKYWSMLHSHLKNSNETLCTVYYAPLNFRDIMLASGKLLADDMPGDFAAQDCVLGLEFAGRDMNGNRVMGIVDSKGLATSIIMAHPEFMWPIPDHLTMEEASTIPVAYLTAFYALIIRGELRANESILIHSGSGSVGQAAISICLSMGCQVFTTVGNEEKKKFLMNTFPALTEDCFANSRDETFEEHVMHHTRGLGVNVVLNSLAEAKLQASVRCLAQHGRFLEIGKYDLARNNPLGMAVFMKNIEFHGILLDAFLDSKYDSPKIVSEKKRVIELILEGVNSGVVQPLNRTIFERDHSEDAFRFMASGKHIGKVIIKIRDEEEQDVWIPKKLLFPAIAKTIFYQHKSYIVAGGLGGFGLELINWLVKNGAKNIVITSRSGATDSFQHMSLKRLKEKSVKCVISTENIAKIEDTKQLIKRATTLGPVGGIFNLAMILSDGLFENQTSEAFENVCAAKVSGTQNLDIISRISCPQLDYFVAFSSVSCGRGNAGQSNYSFANSSMERVCELRRSAGLHGLAIQWGAIGDVGVLFKHEKGSNELNIGGTVPQRIQSCMNVLDKFLQLPGPVYSSLVLSKLQNVSSDKRHNLLQQIANIFGIKNHETLPPTSTLGELGMDSLMAVEVKQIMEKYLDKNFSMQEIRGITIQQLIQLSGEGLSLDKCSNAQKIISIPKIDLPIETFVRLNDIQDGTPVLIFPQIEGTFELLKAVAQKFNKPAIGVNWTRDLKSLDSIHKASDYYIEQFKSIVTDGQYNLVGYSFGSTIAFDIALKLQSNSNNKIKLAFMDSSPYTMTSYLDMYTRMRQANDHQSRLAETLTAFLINIVPLNYELVKQQFLSLQTDQERLEKAAQLLAQHGAAPDIKSEDISEAIETFGRKLEMLFNYQIVDKYDGDVLLIRAKEMYSKFTEDYNVPKMITGKCLLHILPGNHRSFIPNNMDKIVSLVNDNFN